MNAAPVLGIDVDGVIALDEPALTPCVSESVSAWGWWRREICVPVGAADIVARLAEHFEIVWVSAWGHNAHTALTPVLGLPVKPWTFLPVQFDKAAAVAEYAGDRPWLLIADPVGERGPAASDAHVIEVDPAIGIAAVSVDDLLARAAAQP
jgi:hypothetical protein